MAYNKRKLISAHARLRTLHAIIFAQLLFSLGAAADFARIANSTSNLNTAVMQPMSDFGGIFGGRNDHFFSATQESHSVKQGLDELEHTQPIRPSKQPTAAIPGMYWCICFSVALSDNTYVCSCIVQFGQLCASAEWP